MQETFDPEGHELSIYFIKSNEGSNRFLFTKKLKINILEKLSLIK